MNKDEFRDVAAIIVVTQGREWSDADYTVWYEVLKDLPYQPTRKAALALVADYTGFIKPAVLRERANAVMGELLDSTPQPLPPADNTLSPEQYVMWRRAWRDAVFSGADAQQANYAALESVGKGALANAQRTNRKTLATPRDAATELADAEREQQAAEAVVESEVLAEQARRHGGPS